MTFMWRTLLLAFLLGLVAAAPSQQVIIGYRTVSKAQADIYNKAKSLVYSESKGGAQIGEGAYLTPNPGGWPGREGDWYCVVSADKSSWDKVQKVWVPEFDNCENKLWFNMDEDVINDGIESLGATKPEKTVRLAKIFGRQYEHIKQLVIPKKLMGGKLSRHGPLGIYVKCCDTLAELPTEVADMNSWPNTLGTPQ